MVPSKIMSYIQLQRQYRLFLVCAVSMITSVTMFAIETRTGGPNSTIYGDDQSNTRFGYCVASAGDVNGDGYADVIVGATGSSFGDVYVFYGKPEGLPSSLNVSNADWHQSGDSSKGLEYGYSVGCAGDVNGDGYSDVFVTDPGFDSSGGKVYVYFGGPSGLSTTPAWEIEGTGGGDRFGESAASAGDVNGDGYADLIVGATEAGDSDTGKVYLYAGNSTGSYSLVWSYPDTDDPNSGDLGTSVACAGDINGDGYADIIIGDPDYSGEDPETYTSFMNNGKVYVFYGKSSWPGSTPDWTRQGRDDYQSMGQTVSSVGDINGDGFSDILIWSPYNGENEAGRVEIWYGTASGISDTSDVLSETFFSDSCPGRVGDINGDGFADFIIAETDYTATSNTVYIYYGNSEGTGNFNHVALDMGTETPQSVAGAGDINGDGFSDFIIGLPDYNISQGEVFIYHGEAGVLNTCPDFSYVGNFTGDKLGYSCAYGDINNDGYCDVIIGVPGANGGKGEVHILLGDPANLAPAGPTWTLVGQTANEKFGSSVACAGDINGDGFDDILIGAPEYASPDGSSAGKVYLYYGGSGNITLGWTAIGENASDMLGAAVSSGGDINGDGYADIIIGAPGYNSSQGKIYIFKGGKSAISSTMNISDADIVIVGENIGDKFGCSVACAGYVNSDEFADFIVGASGFGSAAGKVYCFYGNPDMIYAGGAAEADWKITGNAEGDKFGSSVACAGDTNGDGKSDILVGAPHVSSDSGAAYLFFGGNDSATDANSANWEYYGSTNANFGYSVASAGDVNNDGFDDILIGAPEEGLGGGAYLFLGNNMGPDPMNAVWRYSNENTGEQIGYSVSSAGDINNDGFADVIVAALEPEVGPGMLNFFYGGLCSVDTYHTRILNIVQLNTDSPSRVIPKAGMASAPDKISIGIDAKSFWGRQKVKIEVEAAPIYSAWGDSDTITKVSESWFDTGVTSSGVTIVEEIQTLTEYKLYKWRVRVLYAPFSGTPPINPPHSPWKYFAGSLSNSLFKTELACPSVQASNITFSNITTTSVTISWTHGDGDGAIVVIHQGSAVDSNPVDETMYTANSVFGSGDEIGTGNFVVYMGADTSVTVTGLTEDISYYVKIFEFHKINSSIKYLTTDAMNNPNSITTYTLPVVTTDGVDEPVGISETEYSLTATGTVTDMGIPNATEHGFCWNTIGSPTIDDNVVTLGAVNATGSFSSSISPLISGTTYYIRAYIINTAGTVYGSEVSFVYTFPSVKTDSVTNVTETSATVSGTVLNPGTPNGTDYGFCWNKTGTPTTDDSHVAFGNMPGAGSSFSYDITDLDDDTTYYIRAYAVNAMGTIYGAELSFKTQVLNNPPTIDPIPDLTVSENSGVHTVTLTGISDGDGGSQTISISAVSNNPSVVPDPEVYYTSPASTGTLVFSPVLNARGVAEITVTVSDSGKGCCRSETNTTTERFSVAVKANPDIIRDIRDGEKSSFPDNLVKVGDKVFFTADDGSHGMELWTTNGNYEGTRLVADIKIGSKGSYPHYLSTMGDSLFFAANNGVSGCELWKVSSDGNLSIVKDIYSGEHGSFPHNMTPAGKSLFFCADSSNTSDSALWVTKGTPESTFMLDISSDNEYVSYFPPAYFIGNDKLLIFVADYSTYGPELWKCNPETYEVSLVKDIMEGSAGSYPQDIISFKDKFIFSAFVEGQGRQLWITDGTPEGTQLLKRINNSGDANPQCFTVVNDIVFFVAYTATLGFELWKTDGTSVGTKLVKDIWKGQQSSYPEYLTNVNGVLFFIAEDSKHGIELWKSNGTKDGTILVKDIVEGEKSSDPYELTALGSTLYFVASTPDYGEELWKSDGTEKGTGLLKDIMQGQASSAPSHLTALDNCIIFTADDGIYGREIWKYTPEKNIKQRVNLILTIYPDGSGNINKHTAKQLLTEAGATQMLTASPKKGYSFLGWKVEGNAEISDIYSTTTRITVHSDTIVTAQFGKNSDVASLTILPSLQGITEPSGQIPIIKNVNQMIKAIPKSGYVFDHWIISGNGLVANKYAANTTVKLFSNAVSVSPIFNKASEISTFSPQLSLFINTFQPNKDKILLKNFPLDNFKENFEPMQGQINIGGNIFEIDTTGWRQKGKKWIYTSNSKPKVRIILDSEKHIWDMTGVKCNLTSLNRDTGINIVLRIGDVRSFLNIKTERLCVWKFNPRRDLYVYLPVSGTPFSNFSVNKLTGLYNSQKNSRNKILIKGSFSISGKNSIVENDTVIFVLNKVVYSMKGSQFKRIGNSLKFIYNENNMNFTLDFFKKKWSLTVSKADVLPDNGSFTIFLAVDSYEAKLQLPVKEKNLIQNKIEK